MKFSAEFFVRKNFLEEKEFKISLPEEIVSEVESFGGTGLLSVEYSPTKTRVFSSRLNFSEMEKIVKEIFINYHNIIAFCNNTGGKVKFTRDYVSSAVALNLCLVDADIVGIPIRQPYSEPLADVLRFYSKNIIEWVLNLSKENKLESFSTLISSPSPSRFSPVRTQSVKIKGEKFVILILHRQKTSIYVFKDGLEVDIMDPNFSLALRKMQLFKSL